MNKSTIYSWIIIMSIFSPKIAFANCSKYDFGLLRQGVALTGNRTDTAAGQYAISQLDGAMEECYGGTPEYYQYKMLQMQERQLEQQRQMMQQQQIMNSFGTTCRKLGNAIHCD